MANAVLEEELALLRVELHGVPVDVWRLTVEWSVWLGEEDVDGCVERHPDQSRRCVYAFFVTYSDVCLGDCSI